MQKGPEQRGVDVFQKILDAILSQLGYANVSTTFKGGRSARLEIMIERQDGEAVSIGDCTRVTRKVVDLLEENDPIGGDYMVEVMSPGPSRPLTKKEDFERFIDSYAWICMRGDQEGEKKIQGKILGIRNDVLMLEVEERDEKKTLEIPLENIGKANLKTIY